MENKKPKRNLKSFENVKISIYDAKKDAFVEKFQDHVLEVDDTGVSALKIKNLNGSSAGTITVDQDFQVCTISENKIIFGSDRTGKISAKIQFASSREMKSFKKIVENLNLPNSKKSVFDERSEKFSASNYFMFYGYISQQENMLRDNIRTSTYRRAFLSNLSDFKDKVVLDVGTGTGILAFFAVQAGARKVYAVEASSIARHAETLIQNNNLSEKITVISGKIEEIKLPEKVDMIVSEPMGYMLYNERMLETYLHSRKFLKPGGKMFPTRGDLYMSPFCDPTIYNEMQAKSNFWSQKSFNGVDFSSLKETALKEYMSQPIIEYFPPSICMARSIAHHLDFTTANEFDLHKFEIPLRFVSVKTGDVNGLALWFDVGFFGSESTVWLSTAPTQPPTHWYQIRLLLEKPLLVIKDQTLVGKLVLTANERLSYNIDFELGVEETGIRSSNYGIDLKNPYFRHFMSYYMPYPQSHYFQNPSDFAQDNSNQTTDQVTNGQEASGQN